MTEHKARVFRLPLAELQPSQIYISRVKLARVRAWWQPPSLDTLPPVPVKRLAVGVSPGEPPVEQIIYTDGHTRAFAAHCAGFTVMPVFWDPDELDWAAYRICVQWCHDAGIRTIADLEGRVIDAHSYQHLWLDRCHAMHAKAQSSSQEGLFP